MESPTHTTFKIPEVPSTPLRQLSSEQMNQPRSNANIALSPSLHSFGADGVLGHCSPRQRESISSAVQEKVAFLNSLSGGGSARSPVRRDAVSPSKRDALERTICGYEESQKLIACANAEIEQLRCTIKGQAKQLNMASGRIEKLMEQLADEKQQNEEMRLKYVQEVKKVRKQCFLAEKMQLELQEEAKEAKKELRKRDAELRHANQRKEEAKQEAFERAYAVAGVTEEMEVLREKLKVMEQEKEAAVQELRNYAKRWAGRIEQEASSASRRAHEMVRIASQSEQMDEAGEPTRSGVKKPQTAANPEHHCHQSVSVVPRPFCSEFVDYKASERELFGEPFTLEDHIAELYREVAYYRRELGQAQETIDIMCMECQLQICQCRRAEKQGKQFMHDVDFDVKIQQERIAKKRRLEEDDKAGMLPPVPRVEQGLQLDHEAALEEALQVPLPEKEPQDQRGCLGDGRESTSTTTTAALEDMTQVLVAPTHSSHADLKFTFSVSGSHAAHAERAAPAPPRAESALAMSDIDMFDLWPPKHQPPRPSTALGVRSSDLRSPMRLVPESPGAVTMDKVTSRSEGTTSRRVALKDADGRQQQQQQQQRSVHRRAHSRPPKVGSELQPRSPLSTVTNTEPDRGRSRTPGSPANSTLFAMTPRVKSRGMHTRSQTHDVVPTQHPSQSFTTTTTTTMVPLRSYEEDEQATSQHQQPHHQHSRSHGGFEGQQPFRQSQSAAAAAASDTNAWDTPRISREEALAQIRARRDRARSVNIKTTTAARSRSTNGATDNGSGSSSGSGSGSINNRNNSSHSHNQSAPSSVKRGAAAMLREVSVASMMSAPGRCG